MGNPWSQIVDIYGQGLDRQNQIAQKQLESGRSLPQYFMQGFLEAKKRAMEERRMKMDEESAAANNEYRKAHGEYYRNAEERERIKAQKGEEDAINKAIIEFNNTRQEALLGAPGVEGQGDVLGFLRDNINKKRPGALPEGELLPRGEENTPGEYDDWSTADSQGYEPTHKPYVGTKVVKDRKDLEIKEGLRAILGLRADTEKTYKGAMAGIAGKRADTDRAFKQGRMPFMNARDAAAAEKSRRAPAGVDPNKKIEAYRKVLFSKLSSGLVNDPLFRLKPQDDQIAELAAIAEEVMNMDLTEGEDESE
jgi:hypothetical protein